MRLSAANVRELITEDQHPAAQLLQPLRNGRYGAGDQCGQLFDFSFQLPQQRIVGLDLPVDLAAVSNHAFSFQCACGHTLVNGGLLVQPSGGVAAVVDTLRASVPLQKVVGKVSPCLAPQEGVVLVVPACKVNFVGFVSAAWQADTLAVFVKVIFLFGLRRPCAAPVKWSHGQHDMTMGVAAVGVVNGIINAHSSGNKLRGTVFPDKPDLFLSG